MTDADSTARPSRLRQVLIVGDFADLISGQAKVAIDSALLLADGGIDVTFFAACGPVSAALEHPRIRTVCLDQRTILDDPNRLRAMARGIWNGPALTALRKVTAEHDPASTVLHCHGFAKALSPAIGRVLADGPLRSVFTMHEYFLACPNGGFYDYRRNEICTRKPLGASCIATDCDVRHRAHKMWRLVRGAVAAGPGKLPGGLRDVIFISETQRRAIEAYLPEGVRLHSVPNPVEAGGPQVDWRANRHLVFVGRLSREKGALQLAEAARALGLPVRFVGDGPEADPIRKANPEAEITGWVTPEDVQRHLSEARALVFPSLWYEGQPLVPIEAQLRGIPVVCGRWSAAAEEIRDGENGIVYDTPGTASLVAALGRLDTVGTFDSAALARRVAPEAHRDRLIALYEGLLSTAPRQADRSSPNSRSSAA
ncbi:glycosyltransferase family 4 protein [Jannaschia seohaensis]|uniref:Glycosyl transferase family 1 n=1 Tax=Jannaschia seohaensis TaxID=475081 RepID=A0A2Y9C833_9RHOB|nr:glycosyltransferase family 4 protein [Jannaschia seohaensis]PWJ17546.1 glycosyl transferase family 1 [Jannaschia seohaensis]SSA47693.1 Glycosyl transferases group 1 [Jannaschia seohaensis]